MSDFQGITSRAEVREARLRAFRRRRIGLVFVLCVTLALFGGLTAFGMSSGDEKTTLAAGRSELTEGSAVASRSVGVVEEETEVGDEPAEDLGDEPIDVLLLGIDRRADEGGEEGVRSDAVLIARVEPESGETRLLSIPRDLYLEVEPGEMDRVNAAYALGGVEQTRSVVERYTGVGIDHYAAVDFEGFEDAVDALGGVKVNLEEGQYPETWSNVEPGEQRLNGRRALIYARYRDSPNGDLDRIGHQQQVLAAVKGKFARVGTLARLPGLLGAVEGNVASDVGPLEAVPLVKALAENQRGTSSGIETFTLKGEGTYLDDGRQVLTPNDEENREIISDFLG
jgi:polyisoprenyl-teichoic acid--peptidoglycan teichoic acid transferase